jgi:hypothetical protein
MIFKRNRVIGQNLNFIIEVKMLVCYQELFRRKSSDATKRNNWFLQVQDLFDCLGFSNLWNKQNVIDIASCSEEILLRARDVHRQTDLMRILESTRYGFYINLLETNPVLPWYLKERLPIRIMRNIAQVRIGLGYFKSRVYCHQLSFETCSIRGG